MEEIDINMSEENEKGLTEYQKACRKAKELF